MSIHPEWLSIEDAARHLGGVSSRWVRKQIELRRLRARARIGTGRMTYRIRLTDLVRFEKVYFIDIEDEPNDALIPEPD
jgi:hypothetical protein